MRTAPFDRPRLLADIGGTFARFTLETAPGVFEHTAVLRSADHADFHAAVSAYLASLPGVAVLQAAVAMANPVEGDSVRMTNYHWQFSIEQMRERLGLQTLVVVNDFTALAMALPRLTPQQRRQVGGGSTRERSVIGLIGAGSGLGVSGLIPADAGWVALGTEGGHASFAPRDERELAILRYAGQLHGHVSFERLLSGPGIALIYQALRHQAGLPAQTANPPDALTITRHALDGSDALCVATLEAFCAILGTAASNLAVTQGAFGGIYIGGGIVPRLGAFFDRSAFRQRFEDKGRFNGYCKAIPTFVITEPHATFMGTSAILARQIGALDASHSSALLDQIQRSLASLSPAERRVAGHVIAHPRSAIMAPIAQIALAAQVSQPTVIRFCRSLGCQGLSDFKLRLAASLTGTVPLMHTPVTSADNMLELGVKVLSNTASAILQLRDQLNRETIDRAITLLESAQRVEFYAVGQSGVVADDAQYKFLRLGMPASACTNSRLQPLTAHLLQPGVVVVIISSSGRIDDLLTVADIARERGAAVVAITASQSPLARKADLALIVDHVEDLLTQVPMVSRILHLLVIDILAVGVAMRRHAPGPPALGADAVSALDEASPVLPRPVARRIAPGTSAAVPLAHISSHSR